MQDTPTIAARWFRDCDDLTERHLPQALTHLILELLDCSLPGGSKSLCTVSKLWELIASTHFRLVLSLVFVAEDVSAQLHTLAARCHASLWNQKPK